MKNEIKIGIYMIIGFAVAYFLNLPLLQSAVGTGLEYVHEYAREHIIFSLIPALFIAGAISQLVSTGPVIQVLSGRYGKVRAYLVASISGSVLTVCSCTILPIFSGIYRTGAGLGPAIAFLFAGPAINVVAITFTASVIGWEMSVARIISAITISILIGWIMERTFYKDEQKRINGLAPIAGAGIATWKSILIILMMTLFLISATWSIKTKDDSKVVNPMPGVDVTFAPEESHDSLFPTHDNETVDETVDSIENESDTESIVDINDYKELTTYQQFSVFIYNIKWYLAVFFLLMTLLLSFLFLKKDNVSDWMTSTWDLTKEMIPLLFAGIFIAGFLLRIIPDSWIYTTLGNNTLFANFFASVLGAGTYFANCTEVAIIDGLMKAGVAKGPALALLLSGPVVSLPSLMITWSILGAKKTLMYVMLVVLFSTLAGFIFGLII